MNLQKAKTSYISEWREYNLPQATRAPAFPVLLLSSCPPEIQQDQYWLQLFHCLYQN
jgi:hypothetical protein